MPEALRAVGLKADYVSNKFRGRGIVKGTRDELWLPYVGRSGMLLFSCNKAILETEAELEIYMRENVGGVFLTTGRERKVDVLLLLLKRWSWLEEVNRETSRPFAYMVTISGRWRKRALPSLPTAASP